MDIAQSIGQKIKIMRKAKNLTLKQLSEMTDLSSGFLSQFERGMTNIAIDSLNRIAVALGVPLDSLLKMQQLETDGIPAIRSYEREASQISPQIIQYMLNVHPENFSFLPRIFRLLPLPQKQTIELYSHEGQEFIYVLEGAVTLYIEDNATILYSGDSVHFDSGSRHNWANLSPLPAVILTVSSPNPLMNLDEILSSAKQNDSQKNDQDDNIWSGDH